MVRVQISRIYGQTSCSVVQARTMVKSLNSNAVIEGRRNGFWQAFLKQVFSQQFHSRPHNVKAGHGYGQLYPWVGSRQYKNCNTSFEGNIGLALVAGLAQLKHLRNRTNNMLMLSLWNVLIPSLQLRILLTFVIAVSCHPYESTEIENVNFTFYLHSHTLLLHMQNRCKEIFLFVLLFIYLGKSIWLTLYIYMCLCGQRGENRGWKRHQLVIFSWPSLCYPVAITFLFSQTFLHFPKSYGEDWGCTLQSFATAKKMKEDFANYCTGISCEWNKEA